MRNLIARQRHPHGVAWQGLGVNYGSDVVYGLQADVDQAIIDLSSIRERADRIRFHIPSFNAPEHVIANCLTVIDIAIDMGFKVVWGCTANGTTLTSSNWQTYYDAAVARAAIADAHGIDEYTVANEDEYRIDGTTLPIATFRSNISTLALAVKAVYTGVVSYSVSHNHTFGWIAFGKGNIDRFGLNVYGSNAYDHRFFLYVLNTFYAAFGSSMYISEFSIIDSWPALTMNDSQQKQALRDRLAYIRRLGVAEAYYFTYCHESTDEFALRLADGTYRGMWDLLTRDRPLVRHRA